MDAQRVDQIARTFASRDVPARRADRASRWRLVSKPSGYEPHRRPPHALWSATMFAP